MKAAASLITLRRRSLGMFPPLDEIGVDEPMLVVRRHRGHVGRHA